MKIEKITDDKIKIMINYKELEDNNISIHSFLSNSPESQKLFLALLDIANEDLGFNTQNSKLTYEAISFDNKNFVIFVTKINCLPSFNFIGNTLEKENVTQMQKINTDFLIYKFETMKKVYSFCNFLKETIANVSFESSLYEYNNIFWIKIDIKNLENNLKKHIINIIGEYQNNLFLSDIALIKLKEFSKVIISQNAINILSKL